MPNRNAERILAEYETINARQIIDLLIENGYVPNVPLSNPERLAEAATRWFPKNRVITPSVFDKASGWSTVSWEMALEELGEAPMDLKSPSGIKNIFAALVILAKEEGILL